MQLRERWPDGVLAGALVGAGVLELAFGPEPLHPLNDPHAPLVVAGFLVVCLAAVVARRGQAMRASYAVAALMLVEGIAGDVAYNGGAALLPIFIIAYALGAREERRAAVAGLGLMLASVEGAIVLENVEWVPALFAVAPWAAGRVVRSQVGLLAALEHRTRELELEQGAFARLAVDRERARIARELHDVVSHNLAGVVVQAGAGRVARSAAMDRTAARFAAIRKAGERGLDELARLAEIINTDASETDADRVPLRLDPLIEHARGAGLTVEIERAGGDALLPSNVADAAYRIAQEALTNAIKHAPGATVTMRAALLGDALALDVRDDGGDRAPSALNASGSGIGLHGMRARVAELGGELRAARQPDGGWRVTARLPLHR